MNQKIRQFSFNSSQSTLKYGPKYRAHSRKVYIRLFNVHVHVSMFSIVDKLIGSGFSLEADSESSLANPAGKYLSQIQMI